MPLSQSWSRSEEHTSELQSPCNLVCRLLLEKKKKYHRRIHARLRKSRYMYTITTLLIHGTSLLVAFHLLCITPRDPYLSIMRRYYAESFIPTKYYSTGLCRRSKPCRSSIRVEWLITARSGTSKSTTTGASR